MQIYEVDTSKMNYYNENDPYVVQWLHNLIDNKLIPKGHVDDRSIKDVEPSDLKGFTQCHFFAGIGGWSRALELAGWASDRPVWTGSCPCQPFSNAGKQKGFDDERHLWPELYRLIRKCKPPILFGEQVANAKLWLDLCASDLENEGYAFASALLPACSVGAPHRRNRFWFVAHTTSGRTAADKQPRQLRSAKQSSPDVAHATCKDDGSRDAKTGKRQEQELGNGNLPRNVANTAQQYEHWTRESGTKRWGEYTNGGWWTIEPDVGRVAHGIPARVGKLRALGNSIVPQVAAEFIKIFT